MKKKIAVSNLFSLILGMVITGSLVYAQVNYNSDQVLYDKNGKKISTTEAIDELYSLADGQYNAGYNDGYNAGMQKFIDENACDVIDGTMVHNSANGGATAYNFECSGTYKIEFASAKGGWGADYSMGTSGSGGGTAGSPGTAYSVTAEFSKGQLISYSVGKNGKDASGVTPGAGGQLGGKNGGEGAMASDWAVCRGGGGGGGGYTLIYVDGVATFKANGGAGGSGGHYSGVSCGGSGAGGAGGSTSADSSGYSVTTVGNNKANGYVRITLVSAKYHK